MSVKSDDFIRGLTESQEEKIEDFSLFCPRPIVQNDKQDVSIITNDRGNLCDRGIQNELAEDGLYASNNPFTDVIAKPRISSHENIFEFETESKFSGKIVEIAVREVRLNSVENKSVPHMQIAFVSISYREKVVCKAKPPFNRELHRLLLANEDCNKLSIKLNAVGGNTSVLPLPLPKRNVRDSKVEIDFSIKDNNGKIHSGTVVCTISVSMQGYSAQEENPLYLYRPSNDPNDPQNSLIHLRPRKETPKNKVKYFLLEDPALLFDTDANLSLPKKAQQEISKSPDTVVHEQSTFSLLNISFRNIFQAKRPLRPSSGTFRHHAVRKEVLMLTVLRGVEIPVREESALVQPFVEIEWGGVIRATSTSEGPAPVWQETIHFEVPKQNKKECVKLRLYDQHPAWGQQWLGEARISLENYRNYQELERWISLNPLYSPVMLFGYAQSSPGRSYTRLYVLMKVEQAGSVKSVEDDKINHLCKGIQRCLVTPYRVAGVESPDEAIQLTTFLPSLPARYGPITPRQALNLGKVDHYGRAALLATLLQAFPLESYVLLGSSQTNKWSAYVLSLLENGEIILWDPEIGDRYNVDDSRSSLLKVSRLINHLNIWENMQKSVLPHNLKYDLKSGKDWSSIGPAISSTGNRSVQTIELNVSLEEEEERKRVAQEMEKSLRDQLTQLRSSAGLTTVFNRHAVNLLRSFISKVKGQTNPQLEKRDLKQLYRAYHTHGFVLKLRQSSPEELAEQLTSTKIQTISGPVEFALVCYLQRFAGKIYSTWLAVVILRSRI